MRAVAAGDRDLDALRAPELATRVTERSIFVLPVGATEQHGPHLPFNTDTVIAELAENAAVEIPGAQYAGVTVTRNAKHIDTPAATHMWPILLDKIQQRHREGPCLTAAWEERTLFTQVGRWPQG